MAHNEAHNALVRMALQQLAVNGYTAWPQQTGVWFTEEGRPVRYGKKGGGDIVIILAPHGKYCEAEAKTGTGRQSENQKKHQEYAVERNGGIYILFRSVDELLNRLQEIKTHI